MNALKLSAALMMAVLIAAPPVLAQSPSAMTPQQQGPVFQNPRGVAGGFASSTSKDDATKQKAQNLTPSSDQDAWEKNKQK
jgi:hypothetical protein